MTWNQSNSHRVSLPPTPHPPHTHPRKGAGCFRVKFSTSNPAECLKYSPAHLRIYKNGPPKKRATFFIFSTKDIQKTFQYVISVWKTKTFSEKRLKKFQLLIWDSTCTNLKSLKIGAHEKKMCTSLTSKIKKISKSFYNSLKECEKTHLFMWKGFWNSNSNFEISVAHLWNQWKYTLLSTGPSNEHSELEFFENLKNVLFTVYNPY